MAAEQGGWRDWSTLGEVKDLTEAASEMSDEALAETIDKFNRTIARLIKDRDSLVAIQHARFEAYRRDVDLPAEEIEPVN